MAREKLAGKFHTLLRSDTTRCAAAWKTDGAVENFPAKCNPGLAGLL